MTNRIARAVGAAVLTMAFGVGVAQAQTIVKDASSYTSIPSLTGFATTGNDMTGVSVRAVFSGGTDQLLSWAGTGGSAGGVTGTGWSLGIDGNTNGTAWNFGITDTGLGTLTRLVLNGVPGRTAFDTFDSNLPPSGTPGSGGGVDFLISTGCNGCVATYSNELLTPGAAHGDFLDLFGTLTVDFGSTGPRTSFTFLQDTDSIDQGTIGTTTQVPEPATLALMGAALSLVGVARRRKPRA